MFFDVEAPYPGLGIVLGRGHALEQGDQGVVEPDQNLKARLINKETFPRTLGRARIKGLDGGGSFWRRGP